MSDLLDRISIDSAICGGKPCIRGTRIWVSLILDVLAAGATEQELRAEYPQLTHDDGSRRSRTRRGAFREALRAPECRRGSTPGMTKAPAERLSDN